MKQELNTQLYEEFHENVQPPGVIPAYNDGMYHFILTPIEKNVPKRGKALDVGCGTGIISIYLGNSGFDQVMGIDISTKAIKACQAGAKNLKLDKKLKFEHKLLEDLDEKPVFDFVILSEVLEHLPDDKASLTKLRKVIKDDGILMITVPSERAIGHKLKVKAYKRDGFDEKVGHLRRYNKVSLKKVIESAGFNNVKYYSGEGPIRNMLITSSKLNRYYYYLNRLKLRPALELLDKVLTPILGEAQIIVTAHPAAK